MSKELIAEYMNSLDNAAKVSGGNYPTIGASNFPFLYGYTKSAITQILDELQLTPEQLAVLQSQIDFYSKFYEKSACV